MLFVGGIVRNLIINLKYGKSIITNDIDILVDDSEQPIDLKEVFSNEKNIIINNAGIVKLKYPHGFDIDISKFSDTNSLRKGEKHTVSLKTCLKLGDFNTSAIAYDLDSETIYSYGAIEGIYKKEVELLEKADDKDYIIMTRLIWHSNKLGFKLGPRAIKFIKENYSLKKDKEIIKYIKRREISNNPNYIIAKLREIKTFPSKS